MEDDNKHGITLDQSIDGKDNIISKRVYLSADHSLYYGYKIAEIGLHNVCLHSIVQNDGHGDRIDVINLTRLEARRLAHHILAITQEEHDNLGDLDDHPF